MKFNTFIFKRAGRLSSFIQNSFLILISLVIALILSEIVIRIAKPNFLGFRLPQTKHEVIYGLGFGMIPNQQAYTTDKRVIINSYGFRGPEIREEKPGDPRIMCLGDSLTFGYGVAGPKTYPRQLEMLLNETWPEGDPEVINAGVQRYYTYQEIDQLKRYGVGLNPDVVILGMFANDLGVRPFGLYGKEYETSRDRAGTSFHNRHPWLYLSLKNSAVITLLRLTLPKMMNPKKKNKTNARLEGVVTAKMQKSLLTMEEDLTTFKSLAENYNFVPLVITIPQRIQVAEDFPESLYPQKILQMCEKLNLRAVDLLPIFKDSLKNGNDPYLRWDNHLSPSGHTLVAQEIADQIKRIMPDNF